MTLILLVPVLAACDINNYCEYNSTGNLTLMLINNTDNVYVEGATCSLDYYYTNNSIQTDDGSVYELGLGLYWYPIMEYETLEDGKHRYIWNCSKGTFQAFYGGELEVVSLYLMDKISNVSSEMWVYPNRTITEEVNATLTEADKIEMVQRIWNYANSVVRTGMDFLSQLVWNSEVNPTRTSDEPFRPIPQGVW